MSPRNKKTPPDPSSTYSRPSTANPPSTRENIQAFLDELTASERYNETEGYHYWDRIHPANPELTCQSATCTTSAALAAQHFGGYVTGYAEGENPTAIVAPTGHDFAIIGDYLVDWWATHISGDNPEPILHRHNDRRKIEALYGDPKNWETVQQYHQPGQPAT